MLLTFSVINSSGDWCCLLEPFSHMCDSIFNCTSCNHKSHVSTRTRAGEVEPSSLHRWPHGDYGRTINTIRWNAVSTEVRINVKCHRGINQFNIASKKITEVRSNRMELRSSGMQVAIRLHFCPECPSIIKWTINCYFKWCNAQNYW